LPQFLILSKIRSAIAS